MKVTNLEMTQTSMELFGGLVCIMAVLIIVMNGCKKKSLRMFVHMFITTAIIFFMDGSSYIFQGNTGSFSVMMNRICNLGVFIANFLLIGFFMQYLYKVIEEKGNSITNIYKNLIFVCRVCAYGILIINLFTKWMYFFDQDNYYHRNTGWFVYITLALICLIICLIVIVRYRKEIGKRNFISLIVCGSVPIGTTIAQSFFNGIALTCIGIAISIMIMLFVYLHEWSMEVSEDIKEKEKGRKTIEIILLFVIMAFSMSASIVSCVISIDRISDENFEQDGKIIAHMIGDSIRGDLLRPITVSETMARDYVLKSYLNSSKENDAVRIEDYIARYLGSIQEGFGYQSVFCVSDKSRAYYTAKGIGRYIDTSDFGNDLWYPHYVESNKVYALNVDTDWENNNQLTLFVNKRIEDNNGKLLGVCGIGVDVSQFQKKLKEYEEKYHVKINLADEKGLVMYDTNTERINEIYLENDYYRNVNSDEFYYEEHGKEHRLTKYIDDLGWYLIVHQDNEEKLSALKITSSSIVIFLIGLIMMGVVFAVISMQEQKTSRELEIRRKISLMDEMTGLYNRRAYEDDCKIIEEKGTIWDTTIIMMDVNGLKAANDKIGHNAGDELIIAAAKSMQTTFVEFGKVYRTGGDEFVAILNISKSQLNDALKTFEHIVNSWKGLFIDELAISKGIVICRDHSELQFKELMELADKLMYQDKDAYYARTGKDRRKAR